MSDRTNAASLHYMICATPRTGSSVLSGLLRKTRIAGKPQEFFWTGRRANLLQQNDLPPSTSVSEYAEWIQQEFSTRNGVFGFKIMYPHLKWLLTEIREFTGDTESPDVTLLESMFPNMRYVFITRQDKLRQAISWVKASQTGLFNSQKEERANAESSSQTPAGPSYDFSEISEYIARTISNDRVWETFFQQHKITPLEIVYEDMIGSFDQAVVDVLKFLEIPYDPSKLRKSPPVLQKQADELSENWYRRFLDEAQVNDYQQYVEKSELAESQILEISQQLRETNSPDDVTL